MLAQFWRESFLTDVMIYSWRMLHQKR